MAKVKYYQIILDKSLSAEDKAWKVTDKTEQFFAPIKLLWVQNRHACNLNMGFFIKIFHFEATSNFINFDIYKERLNRKIIDDRNNN